MRGRLIRAGDFTVSLIVFHSLSYEIGQKYLQI